MCNTLRDIIERYEKLNKAYKSIDKYIHHDLSNFEHALFQLRNLYEDASTDSDLMFIYDNLHTTYNHLIKYSIARVTGKCVMYEGRNKLSNSESDVVISYYSNKVASTIRLKIAEEVDKITNEYFNEGMAKCNIIAEQLNDLIKYIAVKPVRPDWYLNYRNSIKDRGIELENQLRGLSKYGLNTDSAQELIGIIQHYYRHLQSITLVEKTVNSVKYALLVENNCNILKGKTLSPEHLQELLNISTSHECNILTYTSDIVRKAGEVQLEMHKLTTYIDLVL